MIMEELRYPVGVQSFSKIIKDGYVYVDKTWIIPMLERYTFYFLGRPRRFGKSLLLSMLHEYYEGNRELFRGLAIDRLRPEEWTPHPVFHIDLNGQDYTVAGSVMDNLNRQLKVYEEKYDVTDAEGSLSDRFITLVQKACRQTGRKVVILIDEYDKPLTDNILDEEQYGVNQGALRGFYSALKTLDPCIELALLTGVTKFGKLNVFSGLNNLIDISLDDEYSAICGITEKELHTYFESGVKAMAAQNGVDTDTMYAELKKRYDGYHFSAGSPDIYNPFSLLLTLSRKKFGDYWFATGTTKMLADLVISNRMDIRNLDGIQSDESTMSDMTRFGSNPVPLLYQSGYLTIKSYDDLLDLYTLGFPNVEVRNGFLNEFLKEYGGISEDAGVNVRILARLLLDGDAQGFMDRLNAFFASMPYDLRKYQSYESYWQTVMYVLLTMLGYYTEAERHTSEGSIDMLVKTPGYIYVMEFKVAGRRRKPLYLTDDDGVTDCLREYEAPYGEEKEEEFVKEEDTARIRRVLDEAVRQIEERCYAGAFGADGRKVIKIAAVFSAARHRLAICKVF